MLIQKTPISLDAPRLAMDSCHSQMFLVLTSMGMGGGCFRGKQWEAGKLREPPGSHILPAQPPTIGPMQGKYLGDFWNYSHCLVSTRQPQNPELFTLRYIYTPE